MIKSLSLQITFVLTVIFYVVCAWSSQLTQLTDLRDSSCKTALSKNADFESSELERLVNKFTNIRKKKSKQVEDIVNRFNKITSPLLRSASRYRYSSEQKELAIALVIVLEGNMSEVARKLDISKTAVRNWVLGYQDRTRRIIINTIKLNEYTNEFKAEAIRLVEHTNGDVLAVSKQLNFSPETLSNWLVKYELETQKGLKIIDPVSGDLMSFEDKMIAAELVDKHYKGDVKKATDRLMFFPQILNVWVRIYEIKTGKRVRKNKTQTHYFSEEKSTAIDLLRKNNGNVSVTAKMLGIPKTTLKNIEEAHYQETGERIRKIKINYDDKTKAYAVEMVKRHNGNVLAATRELNKEGYNVSKSVVHNWTVLYEEQTGERIRITSYDDKTKAYAIDMVKRQGGNVTEATKKLKEEGFNVSIASVWLWISDHEKKTGKRVRRTFRFDKETKTYAIDMVIKNKGNVKAATRELKKAGINISEQSVRNWWNKHKQTAEGNH